MPQEVAVSSLIDKSTFCSFAFAEESRRSDFTDFEITNYNILDSRDVDLNLAENRLNYILLHGCYVITLVEKGVSTFLDQLSIVEKQFLVEKTKICSLSNGPGFDIVAYLNAFPESSLLQVKNDHSFFCINIYQSWQPLFSRVASFVHQTLKQHLFKNLFLGKDLFDENQIQELGFGEYDILLMLNVFLSSKGSPQVVSNTMMKIFAELKSGSLIFFFGSKKCVSKVISLASKVGSMCVKFGPVNVLLTEDEFHNSSMKENGIKQKKCLPAPYFTVFQKTNLDIKSGFRTENQPSIDQMNPDDSMSDTFQYSKDDKSLSLCSSVSDKSHSSNLTSISSTSTSVASLSNPSIFPQKDWSFNADKGNSLCILKDASKDNDLKSGLEINLSSSKVRRRKRREKILTKSSQTDLFDDSTMKAENIDNLDCNKKDSLEKIIQESVCKALENIFHASEPNICCICKRKFESVHDVGLQKIVQDSIWKGIDYASQTYMNQASKATQVDLCEWNEQVGNKETRSVQTFDLTSKNEKRASMNSRLDYGVLENLDKKASQQSLSPDFPNIDKHKQRDIMKSPDLISVIEKCQNSIDAGKKLIEDISTRSAALVRNHHGMNRCVTGFSNLISHNCCGNGPQPCWHHRSTCCNETFPHCSRDELCHFNPSLPSHALKCDYRM